MCGKNTLCSQHDSVVYALSSFGIRDGNEMKPTVEFTVPEYPGYDVSQIVSLVDDF